MKKHSFPLGRLLLESRLITQEQLDRALDLQKNNQKLLGVILIEEGMIDGKKALLPFLAEQWGVDYVYLDKLKISESVLSRLPARAALHYHVMPVSFSGGILTLATEHPLDVQSLDEIASITNCRVIPVLASFEEIARMIKSCYGIGADTIESIKKRPSLKTPVESSSSIASLDGEEDDASIAKFLNQILREAFSSRATDVHIEPLEQDIKIRYRIDGILYDAQVPPRLKQFQEPILSRIKILSGLNIAEKRLPQDGRFKARVKGADLDIRVSFMPTAFGESVVLRLLNTSKLFHIQELGLNAREQEFLLRLIDSPHGIVFLTGPTGSGKTTTLYSCLAHKNTKDKKILTIEDPVEYQLKGITQIQVNPRIGLTFAKGLRSMLRHDPDIMMVGEVRDMETAEIAVQTALTGHLVFSTLHTNDAASGITRLMDMGVPPYLITGTVICFIAQRLVRVLCPDCKQEVEELRKKEFQEICREQGVAGKGKFFKSTGCPSCLHTGFKGREGIYEFLILDEEVKDLIIRKSPLSVIKKKMCSGGMKSLYASGCAKVAEGETTMEEVLRVIQEHE